MSAPFVLAVPSKGRLQENAAAFFARAGLGLTQARGARDYRGSLESLDGVEVAYVSASDIVGLLATGRAHMGITGEDLVRERSEAADQKLAILAPLGFGHASVVVAVPQAWIDVRTMADLDDVAAAFYTRRRERMRVATKYKTLTRQFFADKNVADYRIVESSGATEGAPAAGQAELIVDITTTGTTLADNSLKVLDDGLILRSEASLVASLDARWDDQAREVARQLLGRIAAEESARLTRDVVALFDQRREGLVDEAAKRFNASVRSESVNGLTLVCVQDKVPALADWLIAQGAQHVTVAAMDYVFAPTNPLHERLLARLA